MDGTCNAVMSAGVFTINDYRTEGLQQLRPLPDNSEQRKEGHHVKVISTEGWADGAEGFVRRCVVDFERCTYTATDAMCVKLGS